MSLVSRKFTSSSYHLSLNDKVKSPSFMLWTHIWREVDGIAMTSEPFFFGWLSAYFAGSWHSTHTCWCGRLHFCVWVSVYVYTCVCVGQMLSADAPPQSLSTFLSESSTESGAHQFIRGAGPWTPGSPPSPGITDTPLIWCWLSELRPSCLHDRRFANWSISLDPHILKCVLNTELRVWDLHGHTLGAKA